MTMPQAAGKNKTAQNLDFSLGVDTTWTLDSEGLMKLLLMPHLPNCKHAVCII